ncbi:dynamin family protein [Novispirillum sp. DQ9]|uniref:dynamin family protein n=1 Tax=Novispirillum sp. DQ9 TaxID=3398612 RepID=UPI003C7DDDAA
MTMQQVQGHLRNQFLDVMRELRQSFAEAQQDVADRERALKQALERFTATISVGVSSEQVARDNPLAKFLADLNADLRKQATLWRDGVANHDRNTRFRRNFGDSLLVYVYGKVKAGKSSLGNYVAYGRSNPDARFLEDFAASGEAMAQYGVEACADGAPGPAHHTIQAFGVGVGETTNSIQYFRLEGLTWVDSPGLHSVTPENGDLASLYAESADIIIYPTNAAQPARGSDLKEISKLASAKRKFLAIITKSDTVDEYKDENGKIASRLVMMSPKDRQDQRDWAEASIAKETGLTMDVLSVSVTYAERFGDDPAGLEESGMAALFRTLIDLARSDGVKIKRETPSNNLNAFVDEVTGRAGNGPLSSEHLKRSMEEAQKELESEREALKPRLRAALNRVLAEINPAIESEVHRLAATRDAAALSRACTRIVKDSVNRQLEKELSATVHQLEDVVAAAAAGSTVDGLPVYAEVTRSVTVRTKGRRQPLVSALCAVVGGAIGFVTGGPAGAARGAALGASLGSGLGGAEADDYLIEVPIGTNVHDVVVEATTKASDAARASFDIAEQALADGLIRPISQSIALISSAIQDLEETIHNKVRS